MCEDTKELFWKYVPSRQKILKLAYLDNRFQHVSKIKRNSQKNPLVLDSQVPTHLAHKFEKSTQHCWAGMKACFQFLKKKTFCPEEAGFLHKCMEGC